MEATEIDTANIRLVGSRGDKVTVLMPVQELTKEEALNVAAYLVMCAGDYNCERFDKMFKAIASA